MIAAYVYASRAGRTELSYQNVTTSACCSSRKVVLLLGGTLGTMTCANIDIDSLFKGVPTGEEGSAP